jgi:hypothetical protein
VTGRHVDTKRLDAEYRNLFDQIAAIFRRHDPSGLIGGGAPDDEYDAEVAQVLAGLRRARSVDDAERVIAGVFHEWFGTDPYDDVRFARVAADVWAAWRLSEIRRASAPPPSSGS